MHPSAESLFETKDYNVDVLAVRFYRRRIKMMQSFIIWANRNGKNLSTFQGEIDALQDYTVHLMQVIGKYLQRAAIRKDCLIVNLPDVFWSPYITGDPTAKVTLGGSQKVIRRDRFIDQRFPDPASKLMLPPDSRDFRMFISKKPIEALYAESD